MLRIVETNKKFLTTLIGILLPILLQNLISSSLGFIDMYMVAQLGETEVAAVGIGNQIYFLFLILGFRIADGVSVYTAQFWGKKDLKKINTTLGIGIVCAVLVSIFFTTVVIFFSKDIVSIYNKSPQVIEHGTAFTKIIAISFVLFSLTQVYTSMLRSTKHIKLPVTASIIAVVLNSVLNYFLIYGNGIFPKMGVEGAAISTLISRGVETIIVLGYSKKYSIIAPLRVMLSITKVQVVGYLKTTIPLVGQGVGWALGVSMYSAIYGNISTESFAAYSIAGTVERICLIFFTSIGLATSIIIGNSIGSNRYDIARNYSKKIVSISVILASVISAFVILLRDNVAGIYNINMETKTYLNNLLFVMAFILIAKAVNIAFIMGIFKSGGDTIFIMFVDIGGVWLVGIPIALISTLIFKLPIYYVVALVATEEIVKMLCCFYRFYSNNWIRNLTEFGQKDNGKLIDNTVNL